MKIFDKPALTVEKQISHLKDCGMIIPDEQSAAYWLTHVSYYRLSAYWLAFEHPKGDPGPRFVESTSFDQVVDLYHFDRRLRRMVMRGAEHVEVALRGSWAYALAHHGGPHAYLGRELYADQHEYRQNRSKLANDISKSSETYIRHYRQTYSKPSLPPVWMVAEMMTFGQISRWYSNLSDRALRNAIAAPLGLAETVLVPLVRNITDVRNICAHHGRLWNRGFRLPPKLAQKPIDLAQSLDQAATQAPAKLYNTLTMIAHVVRTVAPESTWAKDLALLAERHPLGELAPMGFPDDWRQRPIWTA